MNNELAEEILRNIAISGTAETKIKIIIATRNNNGNLNHILNLSSGSPRLQTNVIKRFNLVTSQPQSVSILNPFEIRCCLCNKVISYPAWHYVNQYAVNHFHYFICYDALNKDGKPNVKCYKRSL